MLSKQKKKQKQSKTKSKNQSSLTYLFKTSKVKSSQKKTNISQLSIINVRQIQPSLQNFKKNKNPNNNLKKKLKLEKSSSSKFSRTQMDNYNSRHFTQSYAAKQSLKGRNLKQQFKYHNTIPFTQIIEPNKNQMTTLKGRLSLNNNKKKRELSSSKFTAANKSTFCQEIEQPYVQKQKRIIRQMIKKSLIKKNIERSDLLKISEQYQKLIDKIIDLQKNKVKQVSQIDSYQISQKQNLQNQISYEISQDTILQNQGLHTKSYKKQLCPNLSLSNIRKLKINDYDDEFMSHYNQLSESWKRDLAIQKRY